MKPTEFLLALLGLAAFAVFMPLYSEVAGSVQMSAQATWIAGLVLPATVALFVTSWIRPAMTTPVLGLFVLAGALALAPQFWELGSLASGATDNQMASDLMGVAAPLLFVAVVLALGWRNLEVR